LLAKMKNI